MVAAAMRGSVCVASRVLVIARPSWHAPHGTRGGAHTPSAPHAIAGAACWCCTLVLHACAARLWRRHEHATQQDGERWSHRLARRRCSRRSVQWVVLGAARRQRGAAMTSVYAAGQSCVFSRVHAGDGTVRPGKGDQTISYSPQTTQPPLQTEGPGLVLLKATRVVQRAGGDPVAAMFSVSSGSARPKTSPFPAMPGTPAMHSFPPPTAGAASAREAQSTRRSWAGSQSARDALRSRGGQPLSTAMSPPALIKAVLADPPLPLGDILRSGNKRVAKLLPPPGPPSIELPELPPLGRPSARLSAEQQRCVLGTLQRCAAALPRARIVCALSACVGSLRRADTQTPMRP
jgi:hypothetical protein